MAVVDILELSRKHKGRHAELGHHALDNASCFYVQLRATDLKSCGVPLEMESVLAKKV
jgi:hypothetical protein